MPTYEYKCNECEHEFEAFQMITEEPVKICPTCGGKVRRIISGGIGLIFKGSGFYITDYKNAGKRPPESGKSDKSESKKESKDSSSASPKPSSDSKPTKDKATD